jgi:hypothetical protein
VRPAAAVRIAAGLGLLWMLAGCTPAVGPLAPPGPATLYVIDRGWHTDIGLPADELAGPLGALAQPFPGLRVLVLGFGERQYLLSRRADFGEMLSALLPSRSALLATALAGTPQAAFGSDSVVALAVSAAGLARVEAAIWQELEQRDGGAVRLAEGPYPGSVFYAARGTYDAFDTCNTWTMAMLHAGGLPISAAGVVFSGQVMAAARAIAARQASMRDGG